MNNELLWFIFAIVNFVLMLLAYKLFGKTGLFAWIAMGTVIANIQVNKQITLFGLEATLGNIMYGTLFLATDALGEKYGVKIAKKAVFMGFLMLISTVIIMNFAIRFVPNSYDYAQDSIVTLFGLMPRIAIASLSAYIVSQYIDVNVFQIIKNKWPQDRFLWVRNNGSTLVSQLIDTLIFVPGAFLFAPGFETEIIVQIFITTYLIKVLVALLDTPFLYLIKRIKPIEIHE